MSLEGTMQLITQAVRKERGGGGVQIYEKELSNPSYHRSCLLFLFLLLHNKFIGSEKAK